MALTVYTPKLKTLLKKIKNQIEEHHIKNWCCASDGDFTHAADEWLKKAWFHPNPEERAIHLGLLNTRGKTMS